MCLTEDPVIVIKNWIGGFFETVYSGSLQLLKTKLTKEDNFVAFSFAYDRTLCLQ